MHVIEKNCTRPTPVHMPRREEEREGLASFITIVTNGEYGNAAIDLLNQDEVNHTKRYTEWLNAKTIIERLLSGPGKLTDDQWKIATMAMMDISTLLGFKLINAPASNSGLTGRFLQWFRGMFARWSDSQTSDPAHH